MKSGSYFERPYVPDESKTLTGPIEDYVFERGVSVIRVATVVAVVGGLLSLIIAIAGWGIL